jgi:hypothetical protein
MKPATIIKQFPAVVLLVLLLAFNKEGKCQVLNRNQLATAYFNTDAMVFA